MQTLKFLRTLLVTACAVVGAASTQAAEVHIDYTRFKLDNGLTVVVHEDHKAPIVAVSVWYKVGSKDEPEGRTGFAHLFEHLMFNGSENYNDEYFKPFHEVGATAMNGTTWFDRTNYFENVPTPALEMALWMESDRMGHLVGAIDQAKLDEQRGVVQNEKRQGENQPYGMTEERILEGLFPVGHPYRHSTIGSMDDLNAASLDDVKSWFKQYYGAANAVLVLAGDVNVEQAKNLAQKYFGDIAAGPALKRLEAWVPTRDNDTVEVMYDKNVPQTRVYKVWAVPGRVQQDRALLELAASVLGSGKNSRLYQELIYKNQLASNLSVSVQEQQLASQFSIEVTLRPEATEAQVNAIVERVLAEFRSKGPTREELERASTVIRAGMIRGLEQIGGFGGKATALAQGELYAGDPGFYKTLLDWIEDAKPEQVKDSAKQWLGKGFYQLTVRPVPKHQTAATGVDRSKGLPEVGKMPSLKFPDIARSKLKNGINVVLAESHTIPVVNVAMNFDAGYAADASGFKLGSASFTLAMVDEGTRKRDALEISSELEQLGANFNAGSNLDTSTISVSALKENLKPTLSLYADLVRNPAFPAEEIERLRGRWLAQIAQEKAQPVGIALRNLPPMLYGEGHAYGIPMTGSGTEASITSLDRADLVKFHESWIRPDNATLYVVGDTNLEEIMPLLEREFGNWRSPSVALPEKNIGIAKAAKPGVVLIDKPGAPQSLILAGELAPPTGAENNIAISAMNDIIGGNFNARVNMNLREDKHWAYGAYTFLMDARGQRPYMVYAPVQTDKTGDSLKELQKELRDYIGKRPATLDELQKTVANNINSLPGAYETAGAVLSSLLANQRFGRPDDYVTTLTQRYQGLGLEDVNAAAKEVVKPDSLIWMIVGDKEEVLPQLQALGLGEITLLDTDGKPIK